MARGARILSAAAIDPATVESLFGDRIEAAHRSTFDPATGGVAGDARAPARRDPSLRGPDSRADPGRDRSRLCVEAVREPRPRRCCRGANAAARKRCATARAYAGRDRRSISTRPCSPCSTTGCRRCSPASAASPRSIPAPAAALATVLGWDAMQRDRSRSRPRGFDSPAGASHAIDYAAEAGPTVELRPQALVRPCRPSDDRRHASAGAQPHLARRPPDPDDARPARLLGGKLGRGRQGDARPLPPPSLARRPGRRHPRRSAPKMRRIASGIALGTSRSRREPMTRPPASISAPRTPCSPAAPAPTAGSSNSNRASQASRSADRLGGSRRHPRPGAPRLPDAGGGAGLCRARRPRLPRRPGAHAEAQAPGLRGQFQASR